MQGVDRYSLSEPIHCLPRSCLGFRTDEWIYEFLDGIWGEPQPPIVLMNFEVQDGFYWEEDFMDLIMLQHTVQMSTAHSPKSTAHFASDTEGQQIRTAISQRNEKMSIWKLLS